MAETILSILCGEAHWFWDSNNANSINFNKNGTGELICRHELNIWIAAEFEWAPQTPEYLNQSVNISTLKGTRKNPYPFGQFDIEMTLTKQRSSAFRGPEMQSREINECYLTDDAFLPKRYTVKLQQGNFLTPYDAMTPEAEDQYTPKYAFRLAFDTSPYPPRGEWKDPDGAPDAMKMWEWKEFCGRQLPDGVVGGRESGWGNCVVS